MTDPETGQSAVRGERDTTAVRRASSVQSRISSILALGLMSALGLGMLAWYYANAVTRQSRARQGAQALATSRAQGEMPIPSLGRIDPPPPDLPPSPAPPTPTTLPEIPLDVSPANGAASVPGAPLPKTAQELTLERPINCREPSIRRRAPSSKHGARGGAPSPMGPAGMQDTGQLAAMLRPNFSAAVRAQVLPSQRLLLPKGAFIDCTLETAIDSTLPGMTTCIMATDTFGADGRVVLLGAAPSWSVRLAGRSSWDRREYSCYGLRREPQPA